MEIVLLKTGLNSHELIERSELNKRVENQISTFITEETEKATPEIELFQNDSKAKIDELQSNVKYEIESLQKELQEKTEIIQKEFQEKMKVANDSLEAAIKEINDAKAAKIEQFKAEVNAEIQAASVASLDRISLGQLQVPFSEMEVIGNPYVKTITMPFSTDELSRIEKGEVIEPKTYQQKMVKLKHFNSDLEVEIPLV